MLHGKALIVCIDSDRRRAEGRRLLLEQSGYEVLLAASAQTGMELLGQCPADIALVHHELPAMDGQIVASQIKRLKPDVPVALFAGHSTLGDSLSSADAVISEEEPWSIVLDKVKDLVKGSGPYFQLWLENWKNRGPAQPQDSPMPISRKRATRAR